MVYPLFIPRSKDIAAKDYLSHLDKVVVSISLSVASSSCNFEF